jgi:serine/threonine protein kinase
MESDDEKKQSLRDRTTALRHRVLWWMHRYLAFDVAPPPEAFETTPTTLPESDAAPRPRLVTASTAKPSAATLRLTLPVLAKVIPTFAVGERIADVYDVIRVLHVGDLSTAYLAHHRYWDIDLIVKLPSPQLATVPSVLREWVAGANRWAELGVHPNIASCYCVQWVDGVPLALIEYVGTDSVREWITQGRYPGLRVALNVAIDVCHGLEHAHSRGVIHGNLTPDNILLTPQGSPKLSDFEMALAARSQPSTPATSVPDGLQAPLTARHLLCTPAYVAPERWEPAYTPQLSADVFALGICLYEMFFGRLPYASTTGAPRELPVADALCDGDAPPDALVAVLRHCLEWTPYRRPDSVGTVRAELSTLYESLFGAPGGQLSDQSRHAAEWNTKAVSHYLIGNEADADAAWAAALEVDPACLDAWFNRDIAAWRRGRLTDETVLQDLEAVQVAREDRWKLRYLLALVHHERGDLESAQAWLEQAERDRPSVAEVGAALAEIRTALNRTPAPPALVGEHREYVSAVGLRTDGRVALSATYDGTAAFWDVATGNPLRVFEGHDAPVSCVCLNADGSTLLTGSDDGTMRLWDTATGACRRVFETRSGRISSACLSPNGRRLLWASIQSSEHVEQLTLQLWDAQTGRHVRTFEGLTSAVKSVCITADGSWAVTGGDDQTVRVWEVETGACQQVFTGHSHYVSSVCISADNQLILSGSWDRTVRLWDVQSGELLRTFNGHAALVTSVCLSADAKWALSGSWDCTVRLWEVSTGRCVRTFRGHTGLVTGVALSADGRCGLSGSWDRTLRVWDTAADRREACQLRLSGGQGGTAC